jgi:CubicO group peptidase (beta-lactamase class C family)
MSPLVRNCLALVTAVAGSAQAQEIPTTVARGGAGAAMHEYMQRLTALGFHGTVLVAQGDDVVLHQAYGVADPRDGRPNTTGTMFSTGSVTKQFTAAGIMKLASEGRLSVDDPITKYFDGVPEEMRAMTLHHMLTHTAGLHPSYGPDRESISRDDFVERVFDTPLMNPVGDRYEYSNAGYTLLAIIIEKVTGSPYEEYLRETLYLPNGMEHTGLTSLAVTDEMVSRSHNAERDYPSPADRPPDAWHLYGNGGQLSTTADMYRWYRALKEDRLFPGEFKEKMFTRQVAESEGGCYYGYGWTICDTRRGGDVIWHNGGSRGLWSCAIYQYVDDDAVFIVFSNATMDEMPPCDHVAVNLSRILFDEPVEMPPDLTSPPAVDASAFAGVYDVPEGESLVVTAAPGGVSIVPRGQGAMTALFPSEMAPMLAEYNGRTKAMIEALRAGDFERAGADVEMEPDAELTGAQWLRRWWEGHEAPRTIGRVEILGTRLGDGAETYVRLHFADGAAGYRFHWMMGRCFGIAPADPPARTLFAVSPTRFVGFSLEGGNYEAEFPREGTVVLRTGGGELEGRMRE